MASPLLFALRLCIAALGVAQVVPQVVTDRIEDSDTADYEPTYQFKYHVHDLMTMDYKTHEEIGENGSVRGTYTVRESNGDLRVVSYTAGDSKGFQATVRVRPTITSTMEMESKELQRTTEKSSSKNESSQETDAPLKIQLDTGRRVYQARKREHRQSKLEQQPSHEQKQKSAVKTSRTIAFEKIPQLDSEEKFQGKGHINLTMTQITKAGQGKTRTMNLRENRLKMRLPQKELLRIS